MIIHGEITGNIRDPSNQNISGNIINIQDSVHGNITVDDKVVQGDISGDRKSLNGDVVRPEKIAISGDILIPDPTQYDVYQGEYIVTPKSHSSVILQTTNKLMEDDVTVLKVPKWETSNESGITVYIGLEV